MVPLTRLGIPTRILRGRIENLSCARKSHNFAFDDRDRARMGIAAIGAALTVSGGLAVGLSQVSMDTTEEADLLEFDIEGKHVRAWVWVSVFADGDEVEVVAEAVGDAWYGYGIRRLSDSIVALHPHCSSGTYGHIASLVKWWLVITTSVILMFSLMIAGVEWLKESPESFMETILWGLSTSSIVGYPVFALLAISVSRRYMPFVRLAEGIFAAFGWKHPKRIDLPRHTKKNKKPGDHPYLGYFFFRYGEPSRPRYGTQPEDAIDLS
jgi:hypothetical protein